jgi:hypothetical protein
MLTATPTSTATELTGSSVTDRRGPTRSTGNQLTAAALATDFSAAFGLPKAARASSLEQQSAQLCKYGTHLTSRIVSVLDRGDDFLAVIVQATNTGQAEEALFLTVGLRDDRDRIFEMADNGWPAMYDATLADFRKTQPDLLDSGDVIEPGGSGVVLLLYRVAADSAAFVLAPDEWSCR